MNRRAFLKGASALAAVAVAAPVLPVALQPYQLALLDDVAWLERMSQGMCNVLFYGDAMAAPVQFTGLPVISGVVTLPVVPPKGASVVITQLWDNEPRPGRVTWGRHTVYVAA